MEEMNRESRIESLKKKLFSRNEALIHKHKEGTFSQKSFGVESEWKEPEMPHGKAAKVNHAFRSHATLFKKFFVGALIFLVIGVVYAFTMLYFGGNTVSTERVKITITGSAFTAGGEELPIDITVKNQNSVSIDSADLVIEYPRGSDTTDAGDYERKRINLKSLSPGEEISEHISVILYGEQGTTKDIRARLEYTVRGSASTFVKEEVYPIQINTAPLVLSVDAPSQSVSNQDYTLKVKAAVASTHLGKNTIVEVDYPPGFTFTEATPKPTVNNNIFPITKTDVGSENIITIKGRLIGVNSDKKAFRISAGEQDSKDQTKIAVVYNSTVSEVTLGKPFIDAHLTVNGVDQESYTINAVDKVETKIEWANNLPSEVDNLEIRAKLSGNALNKTSIASNGFYDSNTDSVVWDKNSIASFASVQPGAHGTLSLRFASLPLLASSNSVIADPTITIDISVKGSQPDQGVAVKEVTSNDRKNFKVNTDLRLDAATLYSQGPIQNTGPIPPKAGVETTYTLQWKITNTSNKVSKAEVRATLPVNVVFGKLDPASNENLTYNDTTREVIWSVGNISRGAGFVGNAKSVAFQVKFTPSTSQVATTPALLNDATFTATDLFTNTSIQKTSPKLTTSIVGDPSFPPNGSRVVQ